MIYVYRCMSCDSERDIDFPMGEQRRIVKCPVTACGGTAQQVIGAGVQIAPSALEAKGADVRRINRKDAALDRDMVSYKRMRGRGLQPQKIDGSSLIENEVNDGFDIIHKERIQKLAPNEPYESTKQRALEGLEMARSGDWSPV